MSQTRESWGSQIGFILAAAGSAVGLGNIWRFPYLTGENGGALFVLVYLACVVVLGLPVMIGEMALGRATQRNPVGAFRKVQPDTPWFLVGFLGVAAGFIILSFYGVVAGWTVGYVVESARGALSGATKEQLAQHFGRFVASPPQAIGYFLVIMVLSMLIVDRGVTRGIERWSKILMPALFVLLLLVIARSVTLPGASRGLAFLFAPEVGELKAPVLMKAMGQAFFSLSLGMGAMLTYGSYLSRRARIPASAAWVAGVDTSVALLGGLAIFPALFAFGMRPEEGPGLVFTTLPVIFGRIPFGQVFMVIFFVLLVLAALTSTISLVEVIAAYFIDERGWSRRKAVWLMGGAATVLGVPSALSASSLGPDVLGFNFFDLADHVSANYMLPIGALLTSLFVGFRWQRRAALAEVDGDADGTPLGELWLVIVRWVAPFIVAQLILLGFLREFASLAATVDRLTSVLSLFDAAVVAVVIVGAVVYLARGRRRPAD